MMNTKMIPMMMATAFALATGAQAGTPEQDLIANQAALDASAAEVQAANAAIATNGYSAYGQMYVAIAHSKKEIDVLKAIVRRGEEQCSADAAYGQKRGAFWRDMAFALRDEELALNDLLAEMQQKANKIISASEGEFGRIA